jgi:ribosomal protein S18 acetylase RimI-like enzyme
MSVITAYAPGNELLFHPSPAVPTSHKLTLGTASCFGNDSMTIHVRQIHDQDHDSIIEVAKTLHPGWFNELGLQQIADDLQKEHGLVALDNEKVVGFLIYGTDENSKTAELSWVAVRAEFHRKGIGRALVSALEEMLARQEFRSLEVSTVAPTIEYEPYARTRSFYHSIGFSNVQIDKG